MDSKGEESKISYPNIFFMIDSFEEVGPAPPVRPAPAREGGGHGAGRPLQASVSAAVR